MRLATLLHLACPVPGCLGPLGVSPGFAPSPGESEPGELLEAVIACRRCRAEYPVIMGVAILETDLLTYLSAFWEEIDGCSTDSPGLEVSPRMRSWLGIPAVFSSSPGPPLNPAAAASWSTSPYLQSHFDPGSMVSDLTSGWWQDAVGRRPEGDDPYSYLIGIARDQPGGRPGLALDVGSSVGRGAHELADLYEYSVGVDRSFPAVLNARRLLLGRPLPLPEYMLETERGRWESRPLLQPPVRPNLDFVVASAGALPVGTEGVACLAALNVLCAVPEPGALFEEFARTLGAGALLLIATPFWTDDGESPFARGGPRGLVESLAGGYQIVADKELVPWIVRLARRRYNVYLSHCVAAIRTGSGELLEDLG